MIAYSLRCHRGHEFDGWFRDSAAFDEQSSSGQLICPSCNSLRIEKAIMAPAVAGTKRNARAKAGEARQMQQFTTGLRKYVMENADYVGPKFAEEARKIHYGETPERHIYGEATTQGSAGTGRGGRRCRAAAARPGQRQLTSRQARSHPRRASRAKAANEQGVPAFTASPQSYN